MENRGQTRYTSFMLIQVMNSIEVTNLSLITVIYSGDCYKNLHGRPCLQNWRVCSRGLVLFKDAPYTHLYLLDIFDSNVYRK